MRVTHILTPLFMPFLSIAEGQKLPYLLMWKLKGVLEFSRFHFTLH